MQRVWNLLKDWYWKIDLGKVNLSDVELDFLRVFFDMNKVTEIDEFSLEERCFLILKKKSKYLPLIN